MTTHELKIWPDYLQQILRAEKTFELRLDDRGFEPGDKLILREWLPAMNRFTDRGVTVKVLHTLNLKLYRDIKGWRWRLAQWLMPNLTILSIRVESIQGVEEML